MNDAQTSVETRYTESRREWAEQMRYPQAQIRRWQAAFVVVVGLAVVLAVGLVTLAMSARVEPYVVEVDDTGEVRLVGKPDTQDYQPTEAAKKYFVQEFVTNVRARPKDPVVLRKQLEKARALLTSDAITKMDEYIERDDPLGENAKRLAVVDVESIVKESDETYQVTWTERYAGEFQGPDTAKLTGLFTIRSGRPHNEAELRRNPLGIYIDHYSWSTRQ
jgi:type IV secretion system protein VirB5